MTQAELEDAVALGATLAEGRAIGLGLVAYERRRLNRANELVRLPPNLDDHPD